MVERPALRSPHDVIICLLMYTEWWQPSTGSILQVGGARRSKAHPDGLPAGLLDRLAERMELRRRMEHLTAADRELLFRWYVQQAPVGEIARGLKISRRQFFRRRSRAIQTLVDLGQRDRVA